VTAADGATVAAAAGGGTPPAAALGRVLARGEARWCRFAGAAVELLDRPWWEPGARVAEAVAAEACRLLAPTLPGKVVAVGLNYHAHARELGMAVPDEPVLFLKPATAVVGPGEPVVLPAASRQVDYEAELALVVGRRCRGLSPGEAAAAVAGYTCANDVTARDLQRCDGQWTRAKSFDTFCPLGPWVVPAAPAPGVRVRTLLDGAEVQCGEVGDLIVPPLALLAFVSQVMTLEPGDVLLTGTPPGVGPLRRGQTVAVAVDGVGVLVNPVR